MGIEQLLEQLTVAVRELTLAVRESTAARPPLAAEPSPLERLRAAIAQVKTERQALNLWEKAVAALPTAERSVAWGELVGQFNRANARGDGDAVLRAALAAAKASAAPKARLAPTATTTAPVTATAPAGRATGRGR